MSLISPCWSVWHISFPLTIEYNTVEVYSSFGSVIMMNHISLLICIKVWQRKRAEQLSLRSHQIYHCNLFEMVWCFIERGLQLSWKWARFQLLKTYSLGPVSVVENSWLTTEAWGRTMTMMTKSLPAYYILYICHPSCWLVYHYLSKNPDTTALMNTESSQNDLARWQRASIELMWDKETLVGSDAVQRQW